MTAPARLLRGGAWAVADQAASSAASLAAGLLLARWVDPVTFGLLGFATVTLALLVAIHGALVLDPALSFAHQRFKARQSNYLAVVGRAHIALTTLLVAVSLGAALGAAALGAPNLRRPAIFLALAIPGALTLMLARRLALVRLAPRIASLGGAAYLVALVVSFAALHAVRALGLVTALAAMGALSLVVASAMLLVLGRAPAGVEAPPGDDFRGEVARSHWSYGKWALAATVAAWIPANPQVVVVVLNDLGVAPLDASAVMRAAANLMMPALQVNAAVGTFLIPVLSHAPRRPDSEATRFGVGVVAVSLAYGVALAVAGPAVSTWLYAGKYPELATISRILAPLPAMNAVVHLLRARVLARADSRAIFLSYLASCAATIVTIVPLASRYGVAGVAATMVVATAVQAVVLVVAVKQMGEGERGAW